MPYVTRGDLVSTICYTGHTSKSEQISRYQRLLRHFKLLLMLFYKAGGCGFDSDSVIGILHRQNPSGHIKVDSASKINEYEEYFLEG